MIINFPREVARCYMNCFYSQICEFCAWTAASSAGHFREFRIIIELFYLGQKSEGFACFANTCVVALVKICSLIIYVILTYFWLCIFCRIFLNYLTGLEQVSSVFIHPEHFL